MLAVLLPQGLLIRAEGYTYFPNPRPILSLAPAKPVQHEPQELVLNSSWCGGMGGGSLPPPQDPK